MRVVFCGGGTGGHVYPALTVASALRGLVEDDSLELLYVGVRGKIDRDLVEREQIAFHGISAAPLRVGTARGTAKGGLSLAAGVSQSLAILAKFRPDVVFATGGYGSVGVGLTSRLYRRRLLVFLPDVAAGLAVRSLVRVAHLVAVTVPPAAAALPADKTVLTGYPVRPQFFTAGRTESRERLGLDSDLPTLLVSGASSGANRLNQSVVEWGSDFLKMGQIVHISGERDEDLLRHKFAGLPADLRARYHLHAYLHAEMPQAMAAADLAVMRSGASVLGELPATRLPAILVPGEYEGWDQSPNARYLEGEGAAVMLPQSRLDELHAQVMYLINNQARLQAIREALVRLANPEAADRLARLIVELAGRRREAR